MFIYINTLTNVFRPPGLLFNIMTYYVVSNRKSYILSKNQNKNMLQNHRYSFAIEQISIKRGQIFDSLVGVRGYNVQRHFQQYFSYIVAVSFIGGGNQSTRRKPTTRHKSLTNLAHNVASSTPCHQRDSSSQLQWCYALIAQIVGNILPCDHDGMTKIFC